VPGRVLIVSPHFPPVNAPDHQRVRMSLPYLGEFGWEAHVLAVDPRFVEGFRDPVLLQTVPDDLPITRVAALPAGLTRRVGLGNLGLRAFVPLYVAGDRLLRTGRFDVAFFSTTIFPALNFGPAWKRRRGVPYVLDMQDPWVSDYYQRTGVRPPGGRLKYAFAQWLARRGEPRAIRGAARVISVSPDYPTALRSRYPDLPAEHFVVLPFGASERDAEFVASLGIRHSVFDAGDGLVNWTYLGRGGADMALALRGLFRALQRVRATDSRANHLRLHFVGTSYARAGRGQPTVEPLARECGVADLVHEQTDRIPYLEGLALLRSSDAVLVIGSDDPGYSASKVYPCILAGRPLLALLHRDSLAGEVIRKCSAGTVVDFRSGAVPEEISQRTEAELRRLLDLPRGANAATSWTAFAPYTARETTRRLCEILDEAKASKPSSRRMFTPPGRSAANVAADSGTSERSY
jgi:Glycosyl transferase 4-like domain